MPTTGDELKDGFGMLFLFGRVYVLVPVSKVAELIFEPGTES